VEISTGNLWLYPGTAAGVVPGTRVQVGSGFTGWSKLIGGRFDRDTYDDLAAVDDSTGKLWLFPGTAAGNGFGTRVEIGQSGWTRMGKLVAGDFNRGDDYDD